MALTLVTACGARSEIRGAVEEELQRFEAAGESTATIDFSESISGPWTRLVLLCQGVTESEKVDVLGSSWRQGPDTDNRNFFAMAILLEGDRVVEYHNYDFEDQSLAFTYCTPASKGSGFAAVSLPRDRAVLNFTLEPRDFGRPTWFISSEEAQRLVEAGEPGIPDTD